MPDSMTAIISSVVATGRRMKMRDGLMSLPGGCRRGRYRSPTGTSTRTWASRWSILLAIAPPALPAILLCRRSRRGRVGASAAHRDLDAVLELVGAVDHDLVAGRKAARHRHAVAVDRPERDLADRDRVLLGVDEVDERSRRAALDGARRHDRRVVQGVDQELDVDEL